jgi:hypothetical protein
VPKVFEKETQNTFKIPNKFLTLQVTAELHQVSEYALKGSLFGDHLLRSSYQTYTLLSTERRNATINTDDNFMRVNYRYLPKL